MKFKVLPIKKVDDPVKISLQYEFPSDAGNLIYDLIDRKVLFEIEYSDTTNVILGLFDFQALEFKDESLVVM